MTLLQTNATVAVQRRPAGDPSGDPVPVAGLGAVPVYIHERLTAPIASDDGAQYELRVLWDERFDIRDGDLLTGYNPARSGQPAQLNVVRVAASGLGTPLACRVARTVAAFFFPDVCDVLRLSGGSYAYAGALGSAQTVASSVPAYVNPMAMEVYPFAAIPNQPQTRWHVKLPPGTDVQSNDLLAFDGGRRLYAVERLESPRSYETYRQSVCVLSATSGQLGDAYLRPNATVLSQRAGFPVYQDRRVHLAFAQANPQSAIERITGGVATLRIALFDLVDADFSQGDFVTILSEDGASVLPGVATFKLAGVLRRPLPFCILECDAVADIVA